MEDAKDTLSRWAAQLIAITGLNICGWGFLFNLHLAEAGDDKSIPLSILLLPLVAVPFWRLLDLRRWAGLGSCALLFWLSWEGYALLQQKGGRSWTSFLTQFWPSFLCGFGCAVAGAALLYALIFRPRIWRGGF